MTANEKEWLFEIDNHLPGYWTNSRYSLNFNTTVSKQGYLTDLELFPRTGAPFTFNTYIEGGKAYLRLLYGGNPMYAATYQIVKVSQSDRILTIANDAGQSWDFELVEGFRPVNSL